MKTAGRSNHNSTGVPVTQKPAGIIRRILPVLKQRCPHCLKGRVFDGLLTMRPACPACGFDFEPEPGYFTGAMYISYGIAVLSVAPVSAGLYRWGLSDGWIFSEATLQLILTAPLLFRYSRVLWLHLDQMIFPDEGSP